MDTEPPAPAAAAAPGQRDAFTVKERVAVGTAGIVYRAVQEDTGREVTFKVLTGQASHPLDPAKVLALRPRLEGLRHPVIAELVDAYDDPDGFVIVTSWLGGGAGGNHFTSTHGTLSPTEARLVAMRLCGALLAGEQAGFPHGDVKPSNLILADRGPEGLVVQLQDWGLSGCRDWQPDETLQFMAPERHHGHPASVQGDLFSAAATLSSLLTGHPPVEGTNKDDCLKSWGAYDAGVLATERPDLDAHFRQWLGWLLRWQPGDRPKTVAEALDVLNQVITYSAAVEATAQTKAPDATPAPPAQAPPPAARPAGPQPAAARPAPRPAHGPAPASPAAAPVEEGPKVNTAQRLMAAIMLGCVIGAVGVAFMMWAENKWGPDWKKELARKWQERRETPVATVADAQTEPARPPAPAAKVASVTATPQAPVSKLASPAPPKAAPRPGKAKAPSGRLAADSFAAYAVSSQLDGASGGTGWQGPWKASAAVIAESPDKKNKHVRLGGPNLSTMRRELGVTASAAGNSVCVSFLLWHPGEKGPIMLFDVLDTGDGKASAPVMVQPRGDKLHISVQGSTEIIEAPANATSTLALRWEFKPHKNRAKPEVIIQVFLMNPDGTKGAKATTQSKSSRRVLENYSPPPKLTLSLRTTAPSGQPASIRDLRVARTVADALK